ncbi:MULTISPECIES: hypothetical protein [Alcaligenes]|uniref:hypothetical protein n=1 Tax=Alcaligenes TaxID=507 RepID=UPI002AA68BE6|nr:hypothetical protein [Alcaligenes phenolicus]
MKKIAFLAIAAVLLTGCQSMSSGTIWAVSSSQDQFSDVETKMVTVGQWRSSGTIWTKSLNYYPFVGLQDGELFVGIRSGGSYRIPTGTVQMRVDANKAWTIEPSETPVYLAPAPAQPAIPTANNDNATVDLAAVQAEALRNMSKALSPYTAATGEKAKSILREMVAGKTLKYRSVGMNQPASSTGEVVIDASFIQSLKLIGIDPDNI